MGIRPKILRPEQLEVAAQLGLLRLYQEPRLHAIEADVSPETPSNHDAAPYLKLHRPTSPRAPCVRPTIPYEEARLPTPDEFYRPDENDQPAGPTLEELDRWDAEWHDEWETDALDDAEAYGPQHVKHEATLLDFAWDELEIEAPPEEEIPDEDDFWMPE